MRTKVKIEGGYQHGTTKYFQYRLLQLNKSDIRYQAMHPEGAAEIYESRKVE